MNKLNKHKLVLIIVTLISSFSLSAAQEKSVESVDKQANQVLGKQAKSSTANNDNQSTTASQQANPVFASKPRSGIQNHIDDPNFWIYETTVTLQNDYDADGYFSEFSIEFDVDTLFDSADVYARLYLGKDGYFEEYHTTSVFSIYADSSDDSLVVESKLISGFPSYDYEILIELYDTYDDSLVATLNGDNDSHLLLVSLESNNFDVHETTVVIVEEYGGGVGYGVLVLMLIAAYRRFRSK